MLREKHEKSAQRYARTMANTDARTKKSSKRVVTGVDKQLVVAEEDEEDESVTEEGSQNQRGSNKSGKVGDGQTNDEETKVDDENDLGEPSINSDMSDMDIING